MAKLQKLKLFQKRRRSRKLTSRDPWAGTEISLEEEVELTEETRVFRRLSRRRKWKRTLTKSPRWSKIKKEHLVMIELIQGEFPSGFLYGTRTKLESRSCGE